MKTPKATYRVLLVTLAAAAVVCFFVVGLGWYYVLAMSGRVGVLQTEITNMRKESSQLSLLSINLQKVLPQKTVVYGAIPPGKDESTFMADLEATAKANGLAITSSTVGNSKTKATKTGEFSQTVNKSEYYELPISYELTGQYSSFTKFIGELSSLRRLNSVDDITVTSMVTDKASVGTVKATFNVTIYAKK